MPQAITEPNISSASTTVKGCEESPIPRTIFAVNVLMLVKNKVQNTAADLHLSSIPSLLILK